MSHILLTIDVEDWFQVENFKPWIPYSSWPQCELRVERNVHRLLDLFDSIKLEDSPRTAIESATRNPKSDTWPLTPDTRINATFFVLGWLAERLPGMVREICSRGHEVASHGYYHRLCREESAGHLTKDLKYSKELLEDLTGHAIIGYRAPGFSVDDTVLQSIEAAGYTYDSSYNSFGLNPRYGRITNTSNGHGFSFRISDDLHELPISNVTLGPTVLPWGGGGYFRLYPLPLFNMGVKSLLKRQGAFMLYAHPWEIDPNQPRVTNVAPFFRFRHYINLKSTLKKLHSFLVSFKHCNFVTCRQYLQSIFS